ncbi:hypothetical protein INR49_021025 [Caranx melampygus]|nr:hypothetical protein INR49_021025 [Caranx melampygus]
MAVMVTFTEEKLLVSGLDVFLHVHTGSVELSQSIQLPPRWRRDGSSVRCCAEQGLFPQQIPAELSPSRAAAGMTAGD